MTIDIKILIQSVSDIITNSSSEIFMIYTDESVNKVKNLVNAILSSTGVPYRFDNLFSIEPSFDYDNALEKYQFEKDTKGFPTNEELVKFVKDYDNEHYDDPPLIDGIMVTPKKDTPEYQEIAKLIEEIPNMFDHAEFYC